MNVIAGEAREVGYADGRNDPAMATSEMRDKGIAIANQAVDADNAGNYKDAIEKYGKATEYLITALKSEKNPVTQKTIRDKCNEYLSRMDQLKKGQEPKAAAAGSGGGKGKEERKAKSEKKTEGEKEKGKKKGRRLDDFFDSEEEKAFVVLKPEDQKKEE